jgi:hypothetical protein
LSNYTKSTNFATKDNLTPGDPLKIVRGTEIDTEFNNIATAIATKTDNASAAITGGTINDTTIGATTASTGAFTTLAASGAVTLSGGTANGVAYLNGSKVVTSGSALTFDGTNFFGGTNIYASGRFYAQRSSSSLNLPIAGYTDGSAGTVLSGTKGDIVAFGNAGGDGVIFANNNTEQMRLNSTGLGIGTSSPAQKLHVLGSSGAVSRTSVGANANQVFHQIDNSVNTIEIGALASGTAYLSSNGAYPLTFYTNGSERLRLDSSGNLGLGVTPSAWDSSFKALQVSNISLFSQDSTGAGWWSKNARNVGGTWYYIGTGFASYIEQGAGAFKWNTAPSGTAGANITFTQAMSLDASGNLLVGATSAVGRFTLEGSSTTVETTLRSTGGVGTNNRARIIAGYQSGGSDYGGYLAFNTTSSSNVNNEAARIDSSGNLLVGTTSAATGSVGAGFQVQNNSGTGSTINIGHPNGASSGFSYALFSYDNSIIGSIGQSGTTAVLFNTTSDQRLKENITDADSASTLIDALQVRKFDWKSDNSHQRYGFVAQELVTVAPEAVHQPEDTEQMMGVDYSKLVPMLVKEIQSLRQRVAQLESN